MKSLKLFRVASVAIFIISAAACGGGGDGTPTSTTDSNGTAVSSAVAGTCATSSSNAAGSGAEGLSYGGSAADKVREGLVNHIAALAADHVASAYGPDDLLRGGKSLSNRKSGASSYSFDNVTVTNPAGQGSAILSGTLTLTPTQSGDTLTVSMAGTINTTITDWAAAVTVGGQTYNEVIDGTWSMEFGGTVTVTDGQPPAVSVSLTATISGSNIAVTGTVSGTASISGFQVAVSGSGTEASNYSATCSGEVTVTVTGGSQATCVIASNCAGCQ